MLSNTAATLKGSKSVQLICTGNEKTHATVVLAAKGDGTKFQPFVVFKKGIREVAKLQNLEGVIVRSSINGWMNDGLTSDWLQTVPGRTTTPSRMLVWDSYKCHIRDSTKMELGNCYLLTAVIPGGCTKYIQAPDLSWNKPFKAQVTEFYDSWISGDQDKEYTKGGGNLKVN